MAPIPFLVFNGSAKSEYVQAYRGSSHTKSLTEIMSEVALIRSQQQVFADRESGARKLQAFVRKIIAKKQLAKLADERIEAIVENIDWTDPESILLLAYPIKFSESSEAILRRVYMALIQAITPSKLKELNEAVLDRPRWCYALKQLFVLSLTNELVPEVSLRFCLMEKLIIPSSPVSRCFQLPSWLIYYDSPDCPESLHPSYYAFIGRVWQARVVNSADQVKNHYLLDSLARLILAPLKFEEQPFERRLNSSKSRASIIYSVAKLYFCRQLSHFRQLAQSILMAYRRDPFVFAFDKLVQGVERSVNELDDSVIHVHRLIYDLAIACMQHIEDRNTRSNPSPAEIQSFMLVGNRTLTAIWEIFESNEKVMIDSRINFMLMVRDQINEFVKTTIDDRYSLIASPDCPLAISFFELVWHVLKQCPRSSSKTPRSKLPPCTLEANKIMTSIAVHESLVELACEFIAKSSSLKYIFDEHIERAIEAALSLISIHIYAADFDRLDYCLSLYPMCLHLYLICVSSIVTEVKQIVVSDKTQIMAKLELSYCLATFLNAVRNRHFVNSRTVSDKVAFFMETEASLLNDPMIHDRDYSRVNLRKSGWSSRLFHDIFIDFSFSQISRFTDNDLFTMLLFRQTPFLVYLDSRIDILYGFIRHNVGLLPADRSSDSEAHVNIRRNSIYDDGRREFANHANIGRLREPVILMVNKFGLDEYGVDGGGIMREFLNLFIQEAVDPNRGLFEYTSSNTIIPSRVKAIGYMDDYVVIGRILGKMILEGYTCDVTFAENFLEELVGPNRLYCDDNDDSFTIVELDDSLAANSILNQNYCMHRYMCDLDDWIANKRTFNLNHLKAIDDSLFVGLSQLTRLNDEMLRSIGVDVSDYVSSAGEGDLCEKLLPTFLREMIKQSLYVSISKQAMAIRTGISNLLGPMIFSALKIILPEEMQMLLGGCVLRTIDVDDWRANSIYTGSYHADHPIINQFWQVIEAFSHEERLLLLKFVTSSDRLPIAGFRGLSPPFTIGDFGRDTSRWPTAQTCINALTLPPYEDARTMSENIKRSIQYQHGFELS